MRLSDAILLGASLRPQAFGRMFGDNGSCALGAAMEAVGGGIAFARLWPWGELLVHGCPFEMEGCVGYRHGQVFHVITHLNDYHRWSREQIAEWVRTVEPAGEEVVEEKKEEVELCCV